MDILKKATQYLSKYRYAALIILAGVVLMLLPGRPSERQVSQTTEHVDQQMDLSQELIAILEQIRGVGKVRVLLTVEEGEKLLYQQDIQGDRTQTVILTDSERSENGLIYQTMPPRYRGAVVVCQGADDPLVQLQVIEAVGKLTGLRSDRISVLRMK
jgi:stage III sporulation protein AG